MFSLNFQISGAPDDSRVLKKQNLSYIEVPVMDRSKCNETIFKVRHSMLPQYNFCYGGIADKYTGQEDDGGKFFLVFSFFSFLFYHLSLIVKSL